MVNAQNDAPVFATISEQNTNEDNDLVIDLSTYASDADGDSLTYSVTSCATNITCSISGDNLTLSPTANYSGATHNITVEADDGNSSTDDTSFNLVVNAQNDAPVFTTISEQNTNEDNDLVIDLSTYASDADGNSLSYSVTSCATNITCSISGDNLTLSPAANYSGATHNITVEADDGNSGTGDTSFNLVVNAQNDAPTWSAIPDQSLDDGDNVVINLNSYASDIEGDSLSYSATSCGTNLTCTISSNSLTVTVSGGSGSTVSVTIEADDNNGGTNSDTFDITITTPANNAPTITAVDQTTTEDNAIVVDMSTWGNDADADSLTYSVTSCATNITCSLSGTNLTLTPDSNHNGATHSITIKVDDGTNNNSDTFNLNVSAQNDAPTWSVIPDQSIDDGDNVVINLNTHASDIDGDSLSYSATSCGANLTCSISSNSLTITVSGGSGSTVSVTIEADDNNGGTNSDTFDITITTPANNAPTITAVDQTTTEDNAIVVDMSTWGNDADADSLTYSVTSCATNITCSLSGTNLTLTPDSNHNGATHSITIKVDDGTNNNSDTFNLNVSAQNDAPTWSVIPDQSIDDGDNVVINLNTYASDIEGDSLSYSATSCGANLTCSISSNSLTITVSGGSGSTVSVTIEADDSHGGTNSDSFDVTISSSANNAPTITAVDQSTNEDNALVVDISDWGSDADNDSLTYALSSCSDNITCSLIGSSLTLTPDANHYGSSHTITLLVSDTSNATATDSFNLDVVSVNDAPTFTAIGDIELIEGVSQSVDLLANSQDQDSDALTFSITTCPSPLTCNISADALNIMASSGDGSTVQISIQAQDANGASSSLSINVNISAYVANTYIELDGTRYDHEDSFAISLESVQLDVLEGGGDYQYALSYLGVDANELISANDEGLSIALPESGAFAGHYTLSITDTNNAETITVTLIRPIRVTWSATSLLSDDIQQELIIEGGEAGSQYSLSQLQDSLLTFLDEDESAQSIFIATDDGANFNKAVAKISVATVTTLTSHEVTIATLNNNYDDAISELQIYPVIVHSIEVIDEFGSPIAEAVGTLTSQALLSELNLPLEYIANQDGEMTIRLPDAQAKIQITIQSALYNPATLLLDESLNEHQVVLTAMSQLITLTGSISALGAQNFISHPPVVTLIFRDGGTASVVVVTVSNSSQASFSHDVDINHLALETMRVEQDDSLNIELDISAVTQNQTYNILLERNIAVVTSAPSSGGGGIGPVNVFLLLGLLIILRPSQRRRS